MRIFITGHRGQLGHSLQIHLKDHTLGFGDLPDWDMTNLEMVQDALHEFQPDVVIHAAALTKVDYCAKHPVEAVRVNGVGTYNIAVTCAELHALCVAISSNEVFDGAGDQPYQEYDQRRPINPYGYSKYVAEQVVERYAGRYQVVRTSWLYAAGGTNFIHKVISRAREGGQLRIVTDEVSTPTYVDDLAVAIGQLIETGLPGIYHMVNEGYCSRYEFGQKALAFAGLDVPIEPITSDAFVRPSNPPLFAPLLNVFGAAAGVTMCPWEDALKKYIQTHLSED